MPLFMDLHKAADYDVKPTIEEIKRNHIADLKTQAKYGVRFIQYWVNEEAGLVFCLMEAPDKESCIATHQEAHGNIGCNVIELKGGDYKVFMGNGKVNELDITENRDGTLDSGFRTILAAEIITLSDSALPYKIFKDVVEKFNGREVNCGSGRIISVFNASSQAIACAGNVGQEFRKLKDVQVEIRMGISSGHPVTERDSIFSNALQLADWLCTITMDGQISVSAQMTEACKGMFPATDSDESIFRLLSLSDERFLNSLMAAVEPTIASERISIERLSKILGISKAQLYRKITSFTGYSPNNFIQELKLKKALKLVNRKFGNVAEIAFASGFNSPSYFTKSFQKRFGSLPAKVLRSA